MPLSGRAQPSLCGKRLVSRRFWPRTPGRAYLHGAGRRSRPGPVPSARPERLSTKRRPQPSCPQANSSSAPLSTSSVIPCWGFMVASSDRRHVVGSAADLPAPAGSYGGLTVADQPPWNYPPDGMGNRSNWARPVWGSPTCVPASRSVTGRALTGPLWWSCGGRSTFSSSPDGSQPGSPPHWPRRTSSTSPGEWRGCFSDMGARACALARVPLDPVCRAAGVPTASQQFMVGLAPPWAPVRVRLGKWNPLAQRVRVAGAAAGGTRRRPKARWRPRRGLAPPEAQPGPSRSESHLHGTPSCTEPSPGRRKRPAETR